MSPPVTANSPLGVFDSGVGGLTVVRALRDLLPNESIIFRSHAFQHEITRRA